MFSKLNLKILYFQISALTGTSPPGSKVGSSFCHSYQFLTPTAPGNYPIPDSMKGEYDVNTSCEEKTGVDVDSAVRSEE